ncbi:MAG: RsmB/NOP family class I SAM-dependent RNA methyltransferase [Alkalispirochaeta sp.]
MAREKGPAGFERYYTDIYGSRWAQLKPALLTSTARIAFDEGLTQPYYLDPASVEVARLLPVAGARNILDLCAAPGGKALVVAGRMDPEAEMTANERSRRRRARLMAVLDGHLPPELRRRVSVTGHDAAQWGIYQPASWDAVLADVPCSSEQYVLQDSAELAKWSRSRVKRLAIQQGAILAAAVDALRSGGHALYVTCALTPEENDAVVGKVLRKRADTVTLAALPTLPNAEATEFGVQILPDRASGAGPLYYALVKKLGV